MSKVKWYIYKNLSNNKRLVLDIITIPQGTASTAYNFYKGYYGSDIHFTKYKKFCL